MKREDEHYEKWLDTLKKTQPVLEHPDELTEVIMQRVSRKMEPNPGLQLFSVLSKKQRVLSVFSLSSAVVAGLLLCLLVGETIFSSVSAPMEAERQFARNAVSFSLPDNWKALNALEKSRHLSSFCRHKELQQDQRKRTLEYLVRNQLKSAGYENE